MTIETSSSDNQNSDRAKEVKEFDDSKVGVKGLLDSGITSIPRIFIHPQEFSPKPNLNSSTANQIPIIDLSNPRSVVIDQIHQACRTLGFFQITNHGVSSTFLKRMTDSIKAFNEQPTEVKSKYYHRDMSGGVSFSSNFDLFKTKAASWRDTLQVQLGPTPVNPDLVPEICRSEVFEWDRHVVGLGKTLLGMMSEALGLEEDRLKGLDFLEHKLMVGHYYPYCPQPDLTIGISPHMDPGVFTILLQDQIGGLQVKDGEHWVNVKPLDGALVVNIGDFLELISNGEYKSVEHRVLANPNKQPRISVGVFFNPSDSGELYGPLHELVSQEKPAVYRHFMFDEFLDKFHAKGLDGKTLIDHFRV